MIYDTHVHFDLIRHGELSSVIRRAAAAGVDRLIAVGGSPEANAAAIAIANRFPSQVRAAVGYDRDRAGLEDSLDALASCLADPSVVAVGEIGLDFHYHPETAAAQEELFRAMLALARERRLPVVVHSREAEAATMAALTEHAAGWPADPAGLGVLHCFTGSAAFARQVAALGYHVSFSGILTFRNAGLVREAACVVPDDRLLIETDSPLLAPEPHRGHPNEPANLPLIARALAAARGVSEAHIAALTAANAARLFRTPSPQPS